MFDTLIKKIMTNLVGLRHDRKMLESRKFSEARTRQKFHSAICKLLVSVREILATKGADH